MGQLTLFTRGLDQWLRRNPVTRPTDEQLRARIERKGTAEQRIAREKAKRFSESYRKLLPK